MQRLTVAGRLLITGLVLAAFYIGFKKFGRKEVLEKLKTTDSTEAPIASSTLPDNSSSASAENSDNVASSTTKGSFDYTAPVPIAGKLKGVVELGASGFNSFVVRIDKDKNWKLEKAEFGNSLVTENMATDEDVRAGLKKYIGGMLDYGVGGKEIHFVVSSGALKAEGTQKIIKALKTLNYFVNTVTPEQEGILGLKVVQPKEFADKSFVVDIGSGNTKISWHEGSAIRSLESYGAKYFQNGVDDETVAKEIKAKAKQIPAESRKTCFIIGGVPFELAKAVRKDKERYTVLDLPSAYKLENAKSKAGLNIYKAIAESTGCDKFVFDWDANFTIGFLLSLP